MQLETFTTSRRTHQPTDGLPEAQRQTMPSFVNPDGKTGLSRVYGCPKSDEAGDGKTWGGDAIKRVVLLAHKK